MEMEWNPEAYGRFAGPRLQPALDLLARVSDLPAGAICDLGCGAGAVGPALRARFSGRELIGLDSSGQMLAEARKTGCYDRLIEADIAHWDAAAPMALIYSNAALHWLGDHARLLPQLVARLAPGGMLAVQVPKQNEAPSHRLWRELSGQPDGEGPGILSAAAYHDLLRPLGEVQVWETLYLQELAPVAAGHPVRRFTESTYAAPILQALTPAERRALIARYEAQVAQHYPLRQDGSALFPFRRLFMTLRRV